MKKIVLPMLLAGVMSGCASVDTFDANHMSLVRTLSTPDYNTAVIFVYRSDILFGAAIKYDLWIDGACLGRTAKGVYFYKSVPAGQTYTVSTQGRTTPQHVKLTVEGGKKYFLEQYIDGADNPTKFDRNNPNLGGTNLRIVDEAQGLANIDNLQAAKAGNCKKARISVPN